MRRLWLLVPLAGSWLLHRAGRGGWPAFALLAAPVLLVVLWAVWRQVVRPWRDLSPDERPERVLVGAVGVASALLFAGVLTPWSGGGSHQSPWPSDVTPSLIVLAGSLALGGGVHVADEWLRRGREDRARRAARLARAAATGATADGALSTAAPRRGRAPG